MWRASGLTTLQNNTRNQYIKNYAFDFDFAQAWGSCSVTMTCVTGHLTNLDFTPEFKNWSYPPPESLFSAPVVTNVYDVRMKNMCEYSLLIVCRTKKTSPRTSLNRPNMPVC